ncbi:MAG: hypothetical protein HQL50_14025 [Magnetococcales bacterium]|nr:hypothetical protein [Magnetococcales bacterium]
MEWRMVWTTFFLLMALTTTVSYLFHGNGYELIIAVSMNLIATTLKLGARQTTGAMTMASSLVADFHLIPSLAAFYFLNDLHLARSLALGALVANVISVLLLMIEAVLRHLDMDDFID